MQADLARQWALRLADVLEDDPGAEAELRALVDEIAALLPHSAVSVAAHSVAAGRDVNVRADRGSLAAGVIHGNVAPAGPYRAGSGERPAGSGVTGDIAPGGVPADRGSVGIGQLV